MQQNVNSKENFSPEQWFFIDWLATPSIQRKISTQKKLAEYLNINPVTLSRWKCHDELRMAVNRLIQQRTSEYTPIIINAIKNYAIRGSASHARIFMDYLAPTLETPKDEEVNVQESLNKIEKKYGSQKKERLFLGL